MYKKRSLEGSETPVLYRGRRCLRRLTYVFSGHIVTIVCGYMTQDYSINSWCSESTYIFDARDSSVFIILDFNVYTSQ